MSGCTFILVCFYGLSSMGFARSNLLRCLHVCVGQDREGRDFKDAQWPEEPSYEETEGEAAHWATRKNKLDARIMLTARMLPSPVKEELHSEGEGAKASAGLADDARMAELRAQAIRIERREDEAGRGGPEGGGSAQDAEIDPRAVARYLADVRGSSGAGPSQAGARAHLETVAKGSGRRRDHEAEYIFTKRARDRGNGAPKQGKGKGRSSGQPGAPRYADVVKGDLVACQVKGALEEKGIKLCERGADAVAAHVREGGGLDDCLVRGGVRQVRGASTSSVAESRVPSGSGIPPPPADDQGVDKTRAMFKAVSRGHASELRAALRRVGDVTVNVPGLDHGSFMQAALDVHRQRSAGGPQPPQTLELVSCLLQAKCSPNAPAADGKTPLHMAIQHHASMSPIVARLLLSASADLNARDATQRTPLDYVHEQSVDSGSPAIRQLMDEVTERPTVAVGVVEEESVLGAAFADAENDKVCFFTETSVGVFSVRA
ncbi:unnamed protein product, partial [Prorocentrum cordatum]